MMPAWARLIAPAEAVLPQRERDREDHAGQGEVDQGRLITTARSSGLGQTSRIPSAASRQSPFRSPSAPAGNRRASGSPCRLRPRPPRVAQERDGPVSPNSDPPSAGPARAAPTPARWPPTLLQLPVRTIPAGPRPPPGRRGAGPPRSGDVRTTGQSTTCSINRTSSTASKQGPDASQTTIVRRRSNWSASALPGSSAASRLNAAPIPTTPVIAGEWVSASISSG